ncbi:Abi family protein [Salinibacterium sp. SWN248]|uniref:Abi family protein n=1 Tax=Salinibacterium sp. SWN248 TaxID=2792056 RepID=UPI0018CE8617|nr:Abi family protein [Salinibacterium sp. SWN248]MBH0022990.1 Abi family protein [Salinibacterium sp. SWN248]
MDFSSTGYSKPFASIPEQVDILKSRGIDVGDDAYAEDFLRRCGYYRLSGYTYFYRKNSSSSRVKDGTSLRKLELLYNLDEQLRLVVLEGIGQIEIALRFHVGHRLGRRSSFAHRNPSSLAPSAGVWAANDTAVFRSDQAEWVEAYNREERRSQEEFVKHFRRRYGSRLPVWAATEVMSLGTLRNLFKMMQDNDRKLIAARFEILDRNGDGDSATMEKWINHLRHVRNICAHHGRLWNRTLDVVVPPPAKTTLPELQHLDSIALRKVYGTLTVIRFFLARIQPESCWYARALDVITDFARQGDVSLRNLGFPPGWQNERIWEPKYRGAPIISRLVDAIDALECLNNAEARLHVSTKGNEKAQKDWLQYLRSRGALIAHKLGPQTYYPAFQFAENSFLPIVGHVNANLFSRIVKIEKDQSAQSLRAQEWWSSVSTANGFELSPIQQLEIDPDSVLEASRLWSSTDLVPAGRQIVT